MEKVLGVESAREKLGQLVEDLGSGSLVLTKRGTKVAVLVSIAEFERLKESAAKVARAAARERLRKRLIPIRASVKKAGLPESIVDEAIEEARRSTQE